MSIFYLETNRVSENEFELIQTKTIGLYYSTEILFSKKTEDTRFNAAMLNLGLICKYISENELTRSVVSLLDDRDTIYNNEHFELWRIVHSPFTYQKMKRHYQGLYGKKIAWLDKIYSYIMAYELDIWLHSLDNKRVIPERAEKNKKEFAFNNQARQERFIKQIVNNRK